MIRLHNDYNRGACEKILEKRAQINGESYDGSTFYRELHRLTSLSTRQL